MLVIGSVDDMILTEEEMLKVFMDYDTDFDYVGGTEGDIAWCVAKAQLKKVVEDIELVSSECECGAVVIPRVYLDALLEEVK